MSLKEKAAFGNLQVGKSSMPRNLVLCIIARKATSVYGRPGAVVVVGLAFRNASAEGPRIVFTSRGNSFSMASILPSGSMGSTEQKNGCRRLSK